jgi:hypothetical protein
MYKKVIAFISAFLMVVGLVGCDFEPKREVSEKEYGVGGADMDGFNRGMVDN